MFRKILRRNEVLLITDKKRTHSQDIRHRRRIYNIIQISRVPLLAFAGLCWMMWGLWWVAAIIFVISIPLPWIAVVIANAQKGFNLGLSVLNGAASGLGFALAIVLFASLRERVDKANPPACFKGYPIALIAAGLLALAFMGFSGMSFS